MARPFVFPDPKDRSVNSPSEIVSPTAVLGLYNQDSGEEKMQRVTEKVQNWFLEKAKESDWSTAEFSGNQCVLKVNVKIEKGIKNE